MIRREELIQIGQFNKPHGIEGEITASVNYDFDDLNAFSCLIVEIDGIFVPFFVTNVRTKSYQSILLQIDGINDEREASMLVNKEIYVLDSEFAALDVYDEDEIPVDMLIGYEIIHEGKAIGQICGIEDSTANVLFVVNNDQGQELLIPAVDDFIDSIDTEGKQIHMSLPLELINMQN